MSTEELKIVQDLYNAVSAFDQTLANYEKDSSDANREAFAKAHTDAKALIDNAPIDIKGEISDLWGQIDLNMQGLKVGSNKFMKFSSFGMSAGTSGAQLNMIRGSIGKILKILKDMIGSQPTTPVVKIDQTKPVATEIFCKNCGAKNEADSCFCFSCGHSLTEKEQPVIEPTPVIVSAPEPVVDPVPVIEPTPIVETPEPVAEENALFCPTCGRKNTTGGMFCFSCGTKLGGAPIKQETPVVIQPTYSQPQTAVKPVTTTVVAQSGDKPKSKLATAFAVLGLIFAAVLLLTITTIVLMYNMKYGFKEIQPAQLAEFETYAALCKHRAKIIALLSLIPMAFSLTGLIVSIVKNKKGFNCKVSLVLSIVGLAIAVVAIGNCLLNLYMFGRYEIRYY